MSIRIYRGTPKFKLGIHKHFKVDSVSELHREIIKLYGISIGGRFFGVMIYSDWKI